MKTTKTFGLVEYGGSFRDYQRLLLRRMGSRLEESKLHLITPPGSGKISIGLELVRRMGSPCLILTPTSAMRNHWADAFVSQFLPESEKDQIPEYLSYCLREPALVTVVTYEELSEAFATQQLREEAERKATGEADRPSQGHYGPEAGRVDETDLVHLIQENNIGTVLLDEAHHLKEDWMTALEGFLGVFGGEVRLLSLTATPPYDLSAKAWERYMTLCGEFTDEICVPELVKGHSLCPHRDLIYFSFPTEGESEGIRLHRLRVDQAVMEAAGLGFMSELNRRISKLYNRNNSYLYARRSAVVALFTLLHEYGHPIHTKLYHLLTGRATPPPLTLAVAQEAFQFLLESQTILRDHEKLQLMEVFSRYRILEHDGAQLVTTDKIRRTIRSSGGKLAGVVDITRQEAAALTTDLRELVLMDDMDSNGFLHLNDPGLHHSFTSASILAVLTQKLGMTDVGCLSGQTAVLPAALRESLQDTDSFTFSPIPGTLFAYYSFDDVYQAVAVVTELFRQGQVRVLIGSAEDLSEGWEDSFVNTLILTSCGSSMTEALRIRGRVIHAEATDPHKTAHIWHLVTIERNYDLKEYPEMRLASRQTSADQDISSADYRMLCRQFECFIGPNTLTGELENGVERLNAVRPPFDEEGFKRINQTMLDNTATRSQLGEIWESAMRENTRPVSEVRISRQAKVPVLTPMNTLLLLLATACVIAGLCLLPTVILFTYLSFLMTPEISWVVAILLIADIAAVVWGVVFLIYMFPLLVHHLFTTPSIRSVCKSLLKAMKELGLVDKKAELVMEPIKTQGSLRVYLDNCSHSEQLEFQKAVAEIFTPIDTPRYVMVRAGWFNRLLWRWSFSCPSVISRTDISVKVFAKHIRMSLGPMKFQYTHRELGRRYLMNAQNRSYLNERGVTCEKRLHLLKHDPD